MRIVENRIHDINGIEPGAFPSGYRKHGGVQEYIENA
jgi:hypothetical protein